MACLDTLASSSFMFSPRPKNATAQGFKRCLLQELQDGAQHPGRGAKAGDDVVVGAEDDGAFHHTQWQVRSAVLKSLAV